MVFHSVRGQPSPIDLEAENAWLRDQLGVEIEADKIARLRTLGDIRAQPARLVILPHNRRGRVVTCPFLAEWLPAAGNRLEGDQRNLVAVYVSKARAVLGKSAILSEKSLGYRLSPAMVATLDRLFESVGP